MAVLLSVLLQAATSPVAFLYMAINSSLDKSPNKQFAFDAFMVEIILFVNLLLCNKDTDKKPKKKLFANYSSTMCPIKLPIGYSNVFMFTPSAVSKGNINILFPAKSTRIDASSVLSPSYQLICMTP